MEKKLLFVLIQVLFFTASIYSQTEHRKRRFPVWTFHQDSVIITGLSVGLWTAEEHKKMTTTNGIKVELIGLGLGLPLVPTSPVVKSEEALTKLQSEPRSQHVNGMVISPGGTTCDCKTNGITLGGIGQINTEVNGITASMFINASDINRGLMIAAFNEAFLMRGLQVGLGNGAFRMSGVQVGANNLAEKAQGVQIGLRNEALQLHGIQIGLWNVNSKRKLPLINWDFSKRL